MAEKRPRIELIACPITQGDAPHPSFLNQPIPEVDCGDPLDGVDLEVISGKTFQELVPYLGDELDCFSALLIMEEEANRYYLASYLLYYIDLVERSRFIYPFALVPTIVGIPFYALLKYIKKDQTILWMRSQDKLIDLIVDVLDKIINNSGFEFDGEDLEELTAIRGLLFTHMDRPPEN